MKYKESVAYEPSKGVGRSISHKLSDGFRGSIPYEPSKGVERQCPYKLSKGVGRKGTMVVGIVLFFIGVLILISSLLFLILTKTSEIQHKFYPASVLNSQYIRELQSNVFFTSIAEIAVKKTKDRQDPKSAIDIQKLSDEIRSDFMTIFKDVSSLKEGDIFRNELGQIDLIINNKELFRVFYDDINKKASFLIPLVSEASYSEDGKEIISSRYTYALDISVSA